MAFWLQSLFYIISILYITSTQPETRKLQQVCCRLVALLSSSRYQDTFASLVPACWGHVCCKTECGVNMRLAASWLSTLFIHKLDVLSTSLQISICNKFEFYRLAATWLCQQTCSNLKLAASLLRFWVGTESRSVWSLCYTLNFQYDKNTPQGV